jgi:hypothetical protein
MTATVSVPTTVQRRRGPARCAHDGRDLHPEAAGRQLARLPAHETPEVPLALKEIGAAGALGDKRIGLPPRRPVDFAVDVGLERSLEFDAAHHSSR